MFLSHLLKNPHIAKASEIVILQGFLCIILALGIIVVKQGHIPPATIHDLI